MKPTVMHTTLLLSILGLFVVVIIVVVVLFFRRGRSDAKAASLQPPEMHSFPKSIVWGPVEAPEIEITACSPSTGRDWRQITLPTPTLSRFQALMRDIPDTFRDLSQRTNTYRIAFSPTVTRQLRTGQLEMMKSRLSEAPIAIARDPSTKRVIELPTVVGISPAVVITGLWHVAAMITAQQFLSDISDRLKHLEQAISEIRQTLEAQQHGKLLANHRHIGQIATLVLDGDLSSEEFMTIATPLEDIERSSSAIMHAAFLEMEPLLAVEARKQSWFKLDSMIKSIEENIQNFQNAAKKASLAIHVRFAATQLTAALPIRRLLAERRVHDIREDIQLLEQKTSAHKALALSHIDDVDAKFRRERTKARKRQKLQAQLQASASFLGTIIQSLNSAMQPIEDEIQQANQKGVRWQLEVTLDDKGNVSTVKQFDLASTSENETEKP
jgi:hypothetical protein